MIAFIGFPYAYMRGPHAAPQLCSCVCLVQSVFICDDKLRCVTFFEKVQIKPLFLKKYFLTKLILIGLGNGEILCADFQSATHTPDAFESTWYDILDQIQMRLQKYSTFLCVFLAFMILCDHNANVELKCLTSM